MADFIMGIIIHGSLDTFEKHVTKENMNMISDLYGVPRTIMAIAAQKNRFDMVRHLLEMGANPNVGPAFYSPLAYAVGKRNVLLCELLFSYGANHPDYKGFHHDVFTPALAWVILDHGAKPSEMVVDSPSDELVWIYSYREARAEEALVLLSIRSKSRCISKDVLSLVAEHVWSMRQSLEIN